MTTTTTTQTPLEIDTELAAAWTERYGLEDRQARNATHLQRLAGAEFHYRRSQRVTDMTADEAHAIVAAKAAELNPEDGGYGYTRWPLGQGGSRLGQANEALAAWDELEDALADLDDRIAELEAAYTGWSRFYLVTSSAGHVHSSMGCSSCNPRTRYGWLPELSGKAEAEAVEDLGPTLCTVCFPSAPVEWTEGKKLTKAAAAKRIA